MGKRQLLFLAETGSQINKTATAPLRSPIEPAPLRAQWEVQEVPNVAQACSMAISGNFRVGLLVLDGANAPPRDCEELILSTPHMSWVAALPAQALERSDYRNLIGQGFFDFHTLPPDYPLLSALLGHAYGMARLKDVVRPPHPLNKDDQIIGMSSSMSKALERIQKIASADAPVLIWGESGTGKELVARAIHKQSRRSSQPFIAVNCGALPANLIQTELFGYERGAFTGANQRKLGRIETANGGTLFLDEIGDLPMELQANLLRFLEEHTIERVGGHKPFHVDARIVAATHVNLEKAVAEQRFREDLYYRLNVLGLTLPPLRERAEDIELLAQHYFNQFASERNLPVKGFSRQAIEAMKQYSWPGNIRELINRVRQAMVMCERRLITPSELGLAQSKTLGPTTLKKARESAEREAICASLTRAGNNISLAAKSLGISRLTLYRLMDKLQLHP